MKKLLQIFTIYTLLRMCIGIGTQSKKGDSSMSTSEEFSLMDVNSDSTTNSLVQFSEDGLLNFTELSKKYIRPAEEYDVTTEDGYILKLFRIPGNTSRVFLFCHGVLCSSDDFLIRGKTSLFYMMASKGFDVWAMNCRGNRYSRRHVTLNPDTDRQFWQYSMHEIGIYDYKAVIDFILQKTGEKQLSVAGHSEGTSTFFIFASQRPEYNEKVKLFVAFAPITYRKYPSSGLIITSKLSLITNTVQKIIGSEEVLGYYSSIKKLIDVVCTQGKVGYELCFNTIGILTGFNPNNIEQEFASTIIGHFPAGTSRKNLAHLRSNDYHQRFQQYDYGLMNLAVYGAFKPPAYDVKKVTTKIALFAAKGDKIIGIKDIVRIKMELPNVVHYQVIDDDKFNHIDYMWGRNAHVVLYQFVIDLLLKYT